MEQIKPTKAIMEFFGKGESGRTVTLTELKVLTVGERLELGTLCAKELGKELVTT